MSAPRRARRSGLTVVEPGPLTTVQDRGRPGWAHIGVPPSGAFDRAAADLANRLVGNGADAAVLETTLRGPRLRLVGDTTVNVALTGAPAPLEVGGRAAPFAAAVALRPGAEVWVGQATSGMRSYLAVAGGVVVAAELGSRSTDLLGGLGPPALGAGAHLGVGVPARPVAWPDVAPTALAAPVTTLGITFGPRDDRLGPGGRDALVSTAWTVLADSDRVGVRLGGRALPVADAGLAPEGAVTGSIQVPPSGLPVVFGPDHPVTGGYPVVAVVDDDGLGALAQARPGTSIRFELR